MYRNDIREESFTTFGFFDLYSSNYYVMNSDYRVYICLYNGYENNFVGGPSLDEPTFTDLEPREAVVMVTSGSIFIPSVQVRVSNLTPQTIFLFHLIGRLV